MNKVTYLIGAGASANALPVISNMPERIASAIKILNDYELKISITERFSCSSSESKRDELHNLIRDFEWLYKESSNHATIDTYAKKLYLTNNHNKLKRLKNALSTYFTIEQEIVPKMHKQKQCNKNKVDMRYDAFFASILKDGFVEPSIPYEVTILSWNYDYQIELSLTEYKPRLSPYPGEWLLSDLNVYVKDHREAREGVEYSVFKLNGTTAFLNGRNFSYYRDQIDTLDKLESIVQNYCSGRSKDNHCLMSFAWEDEGQDDMIKSITKKCRETDVLVVIGYSFPFFNRNIDKKLMEIMSETGSPTIYVQDIKPAPIIERIKAIYKNPNMNIIPIEGVDQFYIPNEL